MRALVVLMLLSGIARADGPRATPIGFDHQVHDRDVNISGAETIPCGRCHVDTIAGRGFALARPDHASCFGSCHGAAPAKPKPGQKIAIESPERLKLCTNCHAEVALGAPFTGKLAVSYPPYDREQDFAVTIGHKRHRTFACATCHADTLVKPASPGRPHVRCASSCHDGTPGKGPAMSACETCHVRASGSPQPPSLVPVTVPIVFSHRAHASHAPAGRACATCHASIIDTDDNTLPRPDAKSCALAGCHDAHAAFAITASCTKCHKDPPTRTFHIERPVARFSHAAHAPLTKQPCAACHQLAPSGEIRAGTHDACTGSGCHDDFGSAKPKICGACHNTTEPWRALAADRGPAEASEFGATLDHGKHAEPCASCHQLRTAKHELRTPRGHASCATAGCHAVTSGPAPNMTACNACHVLGEETARLADRTHAPWTVRGMFVHDAAHALACVSCHDDLTATTARAIATPKKATCAPCHDGKAAFKLTGTTCTRCHAGKQP